MTVSSFKNGIFWSSQVFVRFGSLKIALNIIHPDYWVWGLSFPACAWSKCLIPYMLVPLLSPSPFPIRSQPAKVALFLFLHHSELVSALGLCTCYFLRLVHSTLRFSFGDSFVSLIYQLREVLPDHPLAPSAPTFSFMVFIASSIIRGDQCVYCSLPILECECHEGRNVVWLVHSSTPSACNSA